jgi:hypothetical protein
MAIVQNANDEHQFLFAVNTISMVKSDALFSYIAPTNVLAWLLTPLRFVLPFRKFVRLNRTVIKLTHFPILFSIYMYERVVLRIVDYEPTDFVEQRGRAGKAVPGLTLTGASGLFSPAARGLKKQRSIATIQKERALDEVFRRPFRDETFRPDQKSQERRKTVNNWMSTMGSEGKASPPAEQDGEILARLERPRHKVLRELSHRSQSRAFSSATRSAASDPEDFHTSGPLIPLGGRRASGRGEDETNEDLRQQTDADGDDELLTTDDNDAETIGNRASDKENEEHYFQTTPPIHSRFKQPLQPVAVTSPSAAHRATISFDESPSRPERASPVQRASKPHHNRNLSSSTMIYNPLQPSSATPMRYTKRSNTTDVLVPRPTTPLARTPKRQPTSARARPVMPARQATAPALTFGGMPLLNSPHRRQKRSALALDLASDLGDNKEVAGVGVPASFTTQMAWATGGLRGLQHRDTRNNDDSSSRVSKLMLARMNELEQGFKEMLKEVKDLRREGDSGTTSAAVSEASTAINKKSNRLSVPQEPRAALRGRMERREERARMPDVKEHQDGEDDGQGSTGANSV